MFIFFRKESRHNLEVYEYLFEQTSAKHSEWDPDAIQSMYESNNLNKLYRNKVRQTSKISHV